MNNYGEVFRELRVTRGMSIVELADDFVSKSSISRFERMESDLTFEKLIHLLEKLKVSMNEFIYLNSQKQQKRSSLELLSKAIIDNDPNLLRQRLDNEWHLFQNNKNIYSRLIATVLECHYKDLIGEKIEFDQNLQFLTDYFFRCELWTQFDVVLFGNAMAFLPIETAIVISKEIAKKTKTFHNNRQSFETIINTLENITMICLEKGRIEDAKDFLRIIEQLDMDETFILERIIFKFIKGIYIIKVDDEINGRRMVEEALSAMHLAESLQFEHMFRQYFKKVID
ncbi:helix-turn-helix domain-containing protein [Fervidibacillus albus]|uniref:Helix-turn-helix domain-containing protein n=1 Tax=Fervidibacillus albus TaxID=2980026 RepID=A0A9E8RV68_9BACI|nr:Rgg/GadR/MutR family transcriptional regulator [Fervidibacillus albus]WAA09136.1 helix-turn-helix domain-containing protein [Fervidibacillus albus]